MPERKGTTVSSDVERDECDILASDIIAASALMEKYGWPCEAIEQNEFFQSHPEQSLRELVSNAVWETTAGRIDALRQTWLIAARAIFSQYEAKPPHSTIKELDPATAQRATAETVGTSLLSKETGLLIHVWKDKRCAHNYVSLVRRLWQATFECRLFGLACPFSIMFLTEGSYFSVTQIPPLVVVKNAEITDDLLRYMGARLRKALQLPVRTTGPELLPATDGRHYCLSLSFMQVREHKIAGFSRLIARAELLNRVQFSDVSRHLSRLRKDESMEQLVMPSQHGSNLKQQRQQENDGRDTLTFQKYLKEVAVPELVRYLLCDVIPKRSDEQLQPSHMVIDKVLSKAFHFFGVNMALLFFVYRVSSALSGTFPGKSVAILQRTIRTEMVGRVLKEIIREDYALQQQDELDRLSTCQTMYDLCLSRSREFWTRVVEPTLRAKYNVPLDVQWNPEMFSATGAMFCVTLKLGTDFDPARKIFRAFAQCARHQVVFIDVRPPRQAPFIGLSRSAALAADDVGEGCTAVAENQKVGSLQRSVFLARALTVSSLRRSMTYIPRCRQLLVAEVSTVGEDRTEFELRDDHISTSLRRRCMIFEGPVLLASMCDACGQSNSLQDIIARVCSLITREALVEANATIAAQVLLRVAHWQIAFDLRASAVTLQTIRRALQKNQFRFLHSSLISSIVMCLEKVVSAKSTIHKSATREMLPFVTQYVKDLFSDLEASSCFTTKRLRLLVRFVSRGLLRSETARHMEEVNNLAHFAATTAINHCPAGSPDLAKCIICLVCSSAYLTPHLVHPSAATLMLELLSIPTVCQGGLTENVRRLIDHVLSHCESSETSAVVRKYLSNPQLPRADGNVLSIREISIERQIEAVLAPPLTIFVEGTDNAFEMSAATKSSVGASTPSVRDLSTQDPLVLSRSSDDKGSATPTTFNELDQFEGVRDVPQVSVEIAEASQRLNILDEAEIAFGELRLSEKYEMLPDQRGDHLRRKYSPDCAPELTCSLPSLHSSSIFTESRSRAHAFLRNQRPTQAPIQPIPPADYTRDRAICSRSCTTETCSPRGSSPTSRREKSILLELPLVMRRPGDLFARSVGALHQPPRFRRPQHLSFALPYLTATENERLAKRLIKEGLKYVPKT